MRFPIFVGVSLVVFIGLVAFVLRGRDRRPVREIVAIGLLVVVGGMTFAKAGQNAGWPWWIYYTVPMLLTVFLPPIRLRMRGRELPEYFGLSFLSAPAIHVAFSFLLGWKDYMPFIQIPSVWEIVR